VALFSEVYEQNRDLLLKDTLVVVEGGLGVDDFSGQMRLTAESVFSIEQARARFARALALKLIWREDGQINYADLLMELLKPYAGGSCPVSIHYRGADAETGLVLGDAWRVTPSDELLRRLRSRLGVECVTMQYS
jgi:DNA polymerase III subunit alpha